MLAINLWWCCCGCWTDCEHLLCWSLKVIDLARLVVATINSSTFSWDFLEATLTKVRGFLILCCYCVKHWTVPDSTRILASTDSQWAYIAAAIKEFSGWHFSCQSCSDTPCSDCSDCSFQWTAVSCYCFRWHHSTCCSQRSWQSSWACCHSTTPQPTTTSYQASSSAAHYYCWRTRYSWRVPQPLSHWPSSGTCPHHPDTLTNSYRHHQQRT